MPVPPPLSDPSHVEERLDSWVKALEQIVADARVTLDMIRNSMSETPEDEQRENDEHDT